VHVIGLPARVLPVQVELADLDAADREPVERLFAACRAALAPTAPVSFDCAVGDTAAALRAAASREHAGLLLVGRPGHGALVSALVGSVTHALLEASDVPVVVVPPAGDARSAAPGPDATRGPAG
jgi:nucleotide-binding universal stress UspA family protein